MRLPRWFPMVLLAAPLAAQAPPVWRATLGRTITADDADLSAIGQVVLLPSGELAVSQSQDGLVRFIGKTSATPVATFGHTGAGPGEFRSVRWIGTRSGTLWIEDVQLKRVTFVDAAHKLIRTVPEPATLTFGGETQRLAIAFVQGIAPDGSFLEEALKGVDQPKPPWASEAQWNGLPYVLVDTGGKIRTVVAAAPASPCFQSVQTSGHVASFTTPFCSTPISQIASDGSAIVIADMDQVGHTYHVWAMTSAGDTAFSKRFTYKPIPIPAARFDSAMTLARTRLARGGMKPPAVKKPDGYPPLDKLVPGRDGTTWLGEYLIGATRTWRVLDRTGAVIGVVSIPGNVDVQVAERGQVWGIARDKDGDESIVRFTLARP